MVFLRTVIVGTLQTNCYIIGGEDRGEALVIDAGGEADRIIAVLNQHGFELKAILATHAHFDHVLAVDEVRNATAAPFYLHIEDLPILKAAREWARHLLGVEAPPLKVDHLLREGDEFTVGDYSLKVIHTPGHSPGSVSFIGEGMALTGDTLFYGSIGRTDIPGGDHAAIVRSIREKLFKLPDETVVYPGHGPDTTIGDERRTNPFVSDYALKYRRGS